MKTYIGQRGRDRALHVWVESHGRRSPMHGDDVAGRILADVFGPRLIEDDYWCYQTFRDEFMAPRLSESDWSLTENDIREWRASYSAEVSKKQPGPKRDDADGEANSEADQAGEGEAPSAKEIPAEEAQPESGATDDDHNESATSTGPDALVSWPSGFTRAQILHYSSSVVLLEGERPPGGPPPNGAAVRLGLPGLPRMLSGRLAAYGQSGRYLVALGSRAVRGALRVRVNLPGIVRAASLFAPETVRVLDLSSSGARLRGPRLPVGSECELALVPPGRADVVRLRCVVVRIVDEPDQGDVALAFCGGALSFSMDLGRPAQKPAN